MPSRRCWMPAAVLLAAAVAFSAAPAAQAAAPRCSRLAGHDLVKNPKLKVVYRQVKSSAFRGRRYYGCAMPSGRIYGLGQKGTSYQDGEPSTYDGFKLDVNAGTTLVIYASLQEASGAGEEQYAYRGWSLATGKHRVLWETLEAEGGDCVQPFKLGDPTRFVVGANGIVAGVYTTSPCSEEDKVARVVAAVPGQPLSVVDTAPVKDIPKASLKLTGRKLSWSRAGAAMSSAL
jgi:hypothetical protein